MTDGMIAHGMADGYRMFLPALHSALTTEEVFAAYLRSVPGVIPAAIWGFYELDGSTRSMLEVRSNVYGDWLDNYEQVGRHDDPVLRYVAEEQRPIDSSRVVSEAEWQACGARQVLRREGLGHSLQAPLIVSGVLFGTINFARPYNHPAFSNEDIASAAVVSEHMTVAIERSLRYELIGRRTSTLEHVLDRLGHGVIVTNLDGELLYDNRVARNEWRIEVDDEGLVMPGLIGDAVASALSEFRDLGKRVCVQNLEDRATNKRLIVKSFRLSERDRAAVTMVFPCADGPGNQVLPLWSVLTRREQEIAQLVSEGLSTKEISARAYISQNTVKEHLKRTFTKTGVNSRAELIQLIWASGLSEIQAERGSGNPRESGSKVGLRPALNGPGWVTRG